MGVAIRDYFQKGSANPLRVLSPLFDDDVLPVLHPDTQHTHHMV